MLCRRGGPSPCAACVEALRPLANGELSPPPDGVDGAAALCRYEGVATGLVTSLKYHRHRDAVDSIGAALAVMGETAPGEGGRRIAVLGDMLELGEASRNLHLQLGDAVLDARTDLLFACGPDMQALFDVLPEFMRGTSALKSENIIEPLLSRLHAGDVVMVKGSLGTRMGPVVEAIKARLGRKDGGPASGGA